VEDLLQVVVTTLIPIVAVEILLLPARVEVKVLHLFLRLQ
jgi:hypothetical protein